VVAILGLQLRCTTLFVIQYGRVRLEKSGTFLTDGKMINRRSSRQVRVEACDLRDDATNEISWVWLPWCFGLALLLESGPARN
jgi:hypothetical protein